MHAGFPQFPLCLPMVLRASGGDELLKKVLSLAGGRILATSMATLIHVGMAALLLKGARDKSHTHTANAFFADHLEIADPSAPGGKRLYQGRFMIRTKRAGDDMNVLLAFCPKPDKLYMDTLWGRCLNPLAVIHTEALDESKANQLAREVDLTINFRDIEAILGLIGRDNVDMVGLLLENQVQISGNVGHLFKLGAMGAAIQAELARAA